MMDFEKYIKPEIAANWSKLNKYRKWLEVEIAVLEAKEELGLIPDGVAGQIRDKAEFTVETVEAADKAIDQEMVAFLRVVSGFLPLEVRSYFHQGLTSYDIWDTVLSLQIKASNELIKRKMTELIEVLREMACAYRNAFQIGRTHGVHAEPITFGLKILNWADEMERYLDDLEANEPKILLGKISGAVGTYSNIDPRVEEIVCRKFGIYPAKISTQIVARDRHFLWMSLMANIANSLEKFATNIRNLQRTEIGEVQEAFKAGGGSSAMPHKRNPNTAERICSLARMPRAFLIVAGENQALCWDERSLDNSANERIIFPLAAGLVYYALCAFIDEIKGLKVNAARMFENLNLTKGVIFSEDIMLALTQKGMPREEARALVQELALCALDAKAAFGEILKWDRRITEFLSPDEIDACFDVQRYLKHIDQIFARFGL